MIGTSLHMPLPQNESAPRQTDGRALGCRDAFADKLQNGGVRDLMEPAPLGCVHNRVDVFDRDAAPPRPIARHVGGVRLAQISSHALVSGLRRVGPPKEDQIADGFHLARLRHVNANSTLLCACQS